MPPVDSRAAFEPMDNPAPVPRPKPDLIVDSGNLPATAQGLRDLFAECGDLFDRDMPLKLVQPASGGPIAAVPLTVNGVVFEAHRLFRPVKLGPDSERIPVTLPERVAKMYLEMVGDWRLRPLVGITTAPLLAADGRIRDAVGYDPETRLWCCKVPSLLLTDRPRREDAAAALLVLRNAFKTFPFGDSVRRRDAVLGSEVVDIDERPRQDESGFLAALLTAICRASLWLAPGSLVVAPQISGAGTGKGLLVRAISAIAFGVRPRAFSAGHDRHELDKRIVAELVEADPILFLDNVNDTVLRSETLASVLTERPARVRLLGSSRMVALNSTAYIAITGNGLGVSEDLARGFIVSELDAHCEDPEARPFSSGFLDTIERRRAELLSAALTIWRYGRQNAGDLQRGRPLGSFEDWCDWVRDPLLTIGCRDPVERVEAVKSHDPYRQRIAELFQIWHQHHRDEPVRAADLHEQVQQIADPQNRGRQFLASYVGKLTGTRAAGFVLTRQDPIGAWGAATYALCSSAFERSEASGRNGSGDAMVPMVPMPDVVEPSNLAEQEEMWTV